MALHKQANRLMLSDWRQIIFQIIFITDGELLFFSKGRQNGPFVYKWEHLFLYLSLSSFVSLSVCSHSSQSTEETGFNDPSLLENLQSNHVSTVMASQLLSHAQPARNLHTGSDIHTLTPPVFPHGSFLAHISSVLPTWVFISSVPSQN